MAGSFGFERDKYDVSIAIGELELLPAVRQAPPDWLIIADGFSCREQICPGHRPRHALHLAEVLQMALQAEFGLPASRTAPIPNPLDSASAKPRSANSMKRTGLGLAALRRAGLLWQLSRRH